VALLLSGDADYAPLVGRVKSLGKNVLVWFFAAKEDGISPELKLASDALIPLDEEFKRNWAAPVNPTT